MTQQTTAQLQARYEALTPAEKATPQGRLIAAFLPAMRALDVTEAAIDAREAKALAKAGA